jgi:hypothetical protein
MQKYLYRDWPHNDSRQVEQPPITCFMIRREVIKVVGLLDSNFFIYFNDPDWCYRIKKAGFKIFFTTQAKVIHYGEESVKKNKDRYYHWHKDRIYYYRKHFGLYSVFLIKFILLSDFSERLIKLLIKRILNLAQGRDIVEHLNLYFRIMVT